MKIIRTKTIILHSSSSEKMVSREESRFNQGFNGSSHHTMEAEDDDTEVVKNEMPAFHWEDKNFMKQTLKALNKMRKNKQFCDVILRVSFRLYRQTPSRGLAFEKYIRRILDGT